MGFYQNRVLPHLINLAMQQKNLAAYRGRIIPAAEGRVLEIGIGSGLNLPFYSANVASVIGLDPSANLLAMARPARRQDSLPVEFIEGSAESIPLDRASIDTVVTTWTLCSIPEASHALREMHRVLKLGGHLLFVEHGRAPDPKVRWWQEHLTPLWKRIGGGVTSIVQSSLSSRGPVSSSSDLRPATCAGQNR
jgi:ubiquinone/menaquinone biosynthesis C-methylase UbiE